MIKYLLHFLLILACVSGIGCTETATKLNENALLALNVENYDEAMTLLKRAATLEPDNAETHFLLGLAYSGKGQYTETISEYKKALDLKPNDVPTMCWLAYTYLTKGMTDQAITLSKKAIALEPEAERCYYCLGIAYKKQGKHTIASRHLFEAGLLAFIKSKKNLAVQSYRALQEIGPAQTTQELYELLEPFLTPDSKAVNPP